MILALQHYLLINVQVHHCAVMAIRYLFIIAKKKNGGRHTHMNKKIREKFFYK